MNIAILGARGSGKTQLANELARHISKMIPAENVKHFLISDTSPLMAAIELHVQSPNPTRLDDALAKHRIYELTLVCGLDIPSPIEQDRNGVGMSRASVDAQLRATLALANIPYAVVYGLGQARLQAALKAVFPLQGNGIQAKSSNTPHWQWSCDKCSDPACEHQLFTGLLKTSISAN